MVLTYRIWDKSLHRITDRACDITTLPLMEGPGDISRAFRDGLVIFCPTPVM
jgi:hypothetical protein